MGYYINPKDRSKEQWLVDHGKQIPQPTMYREGDNVVVCPDGRLKMWFHVPLEKLIEVGAIKKGEVK